MPKCNERDISHLTMNHVTSPDDHSPAKPPPSNYASVDDLVQDSKSDEYNIDATINLLNPQHQNMAKYLISLIIQISLK